MQGGDTGDNTQAALDDKRGMLLAVEAVADEERPPEDLGIGKLVIG